jgi:hypothetical protein
MSAFKADIESAMRNVSYRLLLNLQSMVLTTFAAAMRQVTLKPRGGRGETCYLS